MQDLHMTKIIAPAARLRYNGCRNAETKVGMQMQPIMPITADSLVKEVVESHPQTIAVFVRHGLNCVGCYVAPFHTITDTAREYALRLEPLLSELNSAIEKAERGL
jgi:hybrid cluster-associated redox disulfide protein